MKNFLKKIDKFQEFQDHLDDHIWTIFSKYLKIMKINFNSPDGWNPDGDGIYFYGEDGCMGCYDKMSLHIPMKFFTDEDAFEKLEQELLDKKEQERQAKEKAKRDKELQEYKRLKKQFEESN